MLLCPVRTCHQPLIREERRVVCESSHSFDVARSGYVNLLQPQDRKSKHPGDTPEAVASRRRLHDRGVTQPLLMGIAELLAPLPSDVVLDAGCGDGFYLGNLARERGLKAHGLDISIPAIDAAARRYKDCEWIVANADLFLPYADESFSKMISITARMNPGEFRRALRSDGHLLIAIPAPDDLKELRGEGRDRAARTVAEFDHDFELRKQRRVTTSAELEKSAVEDVLVSIYRPLRAQPVEAMRLTFSLDLLLFARR